MNEHFSALTAVRSLQAAIAVVRENDLAVLGDTNHDIQTAADELDELLSDPVRSARRSAGVRMMGRLGIKEQMTPDALAAFDELDRKIGAVEEQFELARELEHEQEMLALARRDLPPVLADLSATVAMVRAIDPVKWGPAAKLAKLMLEECERNNTDVLRDLAEGTFE